LIAHYLKNKSNKDGPQPEIPQKIIDRFMAYDWPGNVRELFNEVERFLVTEEVDLSGHLSAQDAGKGSGAVVADNLHLDQAVEEFEKLYLPRALKLHEGHKGKAAESLNVDRKTLYRKLRKFGLD
jgi:transcriptional regulator with PAS, ATPase and Fis domain